MSGLNIQQATLTSAQLAALAGLNNDPPALSAIVEPRQVATLAATLALDGVSGEHSYPLDTHNNAFAQHTGVAGEALPFYRMGQGVCTLQSNVIYYEDGTTENVGATTFTYDYFKHGDRIEWTLASNTDGSGTLVIELDNLATECLRRNAKSLSVDFSFVGAPDLPVTWSYSANAQTISMADITGLATGIGTDMPNHFRVTYNIENDGITASALNDLGAWASTRTAVAAGTTDQLDRYARTLFLDASGTLATHAVKLPQASAWKKVHGNAPLYVICDQIITTLTVSAQAGDTLRYSAVLPAITTLAANGVFGFAPGPFAGGATWTRVL